MMNLKSEANITRFIGIIHDTLHFMAKVKIVVGLFQLLQSHRQQ